MFKFKLVDNELIILLNGKNKIVVPFSSKFEIERLLDTLEGGGGIYRLNDNFLFYWDSGLFFIEIETLVPEMMITLELTTRDRDSLAIVLDSAFDAGVERLIEDFNIRL